MNNNKILTVILILSIVIIFISSCYNKKEIEATRVFPVYVDEDSTVYYNTNKKGLK